MRACSIIACLLLVSCRSGASHSTRLELAPDTYLVVTRTTYPGFLEASVITTLAIRWPHSWFADKIGQTDYSNEPGETRLLKADSYYILVYGRNLYHRPVQGGPWTWWPARNSSYVPPVPSIAAYLGNWFRAHGRTDFEYLPYGDYSSDERVAFERITFRSFPGQQQIVFGSRTGWTLPYRLSDVDAPSNTIRYATTVPGLPRLLVFTGPPNHFGAWQFSPDATSQANQ